VRDLLLGRKIVDADLAVEGNGVAFGRALARELGATPLVHERFGTVSLEFQDGSRLDVASTRTEAYASAGSLPRVARAALEEDLARRDFTINAMALRLAPGRPVLEDPFGGRRDLARKLVRMLHPGSPRDDPTRAFRAVRYANRLGFSIEPRTRRWIRAAVAAGSLDAVSGDRLRRELRLIFSELGRARATATMRRLGLEAAVDPELSVNRQVLEALRRAERIAGRNPGKTGWFLYFLVWAAGLDAGSAERVAARLSLAGEERRRFLQWAASRIELHREDFATAPSRALTAGFSADEIAAAAALLPAKNGRPLERALAALDATLSIRGRDLVEAGVPAGPRIGRALAATLDAVRDGRIAPEDELRFAVAAALAEAS
jgi:tRNA nucleotidyltransferase (CCA-adding enzyme)